MSQTVLILVVVELVQVIPSIVQQCPTMSKTLCFNTRLYYETHMHERSESQTPAFTKYYTKASWEFLVHNVFPWLSNDISNHQGISLPASSNKVLTSAMVSVHGTSLPATCNVSQSIYRKGTGSMGSRRLWQFNAVLHQLSSVLGLGMRDLGCYGTSFCHRKGRFHKKSVRGAQA